MIRWAAALTLIGIVSGLLGFGLINGIAYELAKFVFYVFLGFAVLLLLSAWWVSKRAL